MQRLPVLAVVILMIFSGCTQTEEPVPPRYAGSALALIPEPGLYRLELPDEVYRLAGRDFSDIRISTEPGEPVSWFLIREPSAGLLHDSPAVHFQLADNRFKPGIPGKPGETGERETGSARAIYDYQVVTADGSAPVYYQLDFLFAESGWSLDAALYGRFKDEPWVYIGEDSLFHVGDHIKTRLHTGRAVRFPRVRLELKGRDSYPAISIVKGVSGERRLSSDISEQIALEWSALPPLREGTRRFRVENMDRLPLHRIEVMTEGLFRSGYRLIDGEAREVVAGELYRFEADGEYWMLHSIDLPEKSEGRNLSDWTLEIEDDEGEPVKLTGFKGAFFRDHIVMDAVESGVMKVTWGDSSLEFPDYEVPPSVGGSGLAALELLPLIRLEDVKIVQESGNGGREVNWIALQVLFIFVIMLIISAVGAVVVVQLKKGRS